MTIPGLATPKVAIVVPVYNSGSYLADCVDSVLAQTMPPGELEAVFVDDGSTDGSGATLDRLAATHSHIRVIHEPPSGWAGRPRNVGMDAATADYVLFLDHDDRLGPEAAQRLYDRAVADGSDVVLGRSVGHGRPNGTQLNWRTRGPMRFEDDPELVGHLKPHKLLRRSFLVAHQIRFPEGKVRLEDQVFVLQAYFLATGISVVGDYICYHHERRSDRGNAVTTPWEPEFYYRFVRADLDVVMQHTTPGPFRNRLLRRFVGNEMFGRLTGKKFLAATPERRAGLVKEIQGVLEDYVPPEFDEGLTPPQRTIATLARAGRADLLVVLAQAAARTRPKAVATAMTWLPDRGLELVIDVAFQDVPDGIRIVPLSAGWMLEVPAAVAAVVPAGHRTTSAPIRRQVDVMAVDEGDVATSLEAEVGLVDGAAASASDGSRIHIRAVLPVAEASPAGQHASGRLAFMVQLSLTGHRNRVPVTVRGRPTIEASHNRPNGEDAHAERRPVPSRAGGGRLVLDVGPDDLAKRLRRPLGHARRRVGQCVHLVRARVR